MSPPAWVLSKMVRAYQYFLSPYFGTQCRFTPTCSHFAMGALKKHGAIKGGYLTVRRVLRCHPWQPGGYDPVP
ncbi:MAG: membrane protein insertion efficiency factor YidD [Betaproteobacteria bacterium]